MRLMLLDVTNIFPKNSLTILVQVVLALGVIGCTTRYLTGKNYKSARDEKTRPAVVPYWIPYFGHYLTLCCVNPPQWVCELR